MSGVPESDEKTRIPAVSRPFGRVVSLAALALAVGALACLIARRELVATAAPGIAVQVLALALMIWARLTFGARSFHAGANPTEGGLVTHGPYRWVRHPIYAAVIYVVWAGSLSHPSIAGAALAALVTLCMGVRMLMEESLLTGAYPGYADYARKTKRLIPYVF